MLTLTPDVTALLGRIAAEVTTEANEARRLRALEEDDDHSDDDYSDYSDDSHLDALLQEGAPRRRPLHPRRQVRRLHHHAPVDTPRASPWTRYGIRRRSHHASISVRPRRRRRY
jgi:hypothetical protein